MDADDHPDISSDQVSLSIRREVTKLFCSPCLDDGNYRQARGFCVDCAEHLCNRCFKHHCTTRPFRNHQLLDKQQMPQTKPTNVYADTCNDKCDIHRDKVVEYYCEDHDLFGCTVCVTLGHRTCNVGYIPTLAGEFVNSDEYKAIKNTLESLIQKTTTIQDNTKSNLTNTKIYADRAVAELEDLRKQVNDFFDELEHNIRNEVSKTQREDQKNIDAIIKENDALAQEIHEMKQKLLETESRNQKCRLFVDMKYHQERVHKLCTDLSTLETNNKIRHLSFKPSTCVTDLLNGQSHVLGSLVSFYQTVPVGSQNDSEQECDVTDIAVLSGGRIAIYDCENDNVKIVDTKHGKVITTTSMEVWPHCGLTSVSDNEIALPKDGAIEIYSVADQLALQKTIQNTRLGSPIVYTNNMFIGVTSSTPRTLRMVDMNGGAIKTFPTEVNGENLFVEPWYIGLSPDNTLIYVSDWGNKIVNCLTLEGEVRARYKPDSEWDPRGVVVSRDGDVYVCDCENDCIHILKSDLKKKGVIQGENYGMYGLQGLAYCDRERKLYVGTWLATYVGVFNI